MGDKRSLAKAGEDKVSAQASEIRLDKMVVSNKASAEVVDAKAEQTLKANAVAQKELTKAKTAKTTEVLKDQGSDKTCDNCQQAEAELAAKDKEISKDKKKLSNAKEDSKMQVKVAATAEKAEKDAIKDIKAQKSAQKAIKPKGKKAAAKKAEAKPEAKGKEKAKATNKKPVD